MKKEMEETWNKIGDYFSERHKWDEAVQYYEKARNIDQVKIPYSMGSTRHCFRGGQKFLGC